MANKDELLEYYLREITYLRKMGVEYARKYPKIAGRLELGIDQSPDPHVERLLESFAFLTGRVQYNIDNQLPEVSSALLNILYPHYLAPVPSMAIAKFEHDPAQGKLTEGYVLKKHTSLLAPSKQGAVMRFRTCYPVTLYPLEVLEACFESTAKYDFLDNKPNIATVLRVRIGAVGAALGDIDFNALRFYLNGERTAVSSLYEMLFGSLRDICIVPQDSQKPVMLPKNTLKSVGFGMDEEALPYPGNSHPQYRLLQEYFIFPEKFFFIDVENLSNHNSQKYFDLVFQFDQLPQGRVSVDENTFQLGCVPMINLFRKISDPIRLDHRKSEYRLTPDSRRERFTEIHSVLSVSSSSDYEDVTKRLEPFFSYNHAKEYRDQTSFWHLRPQETGRENLPGTEMYISIVDLNFRPTDSPTQTLYAHTLCTNRNMASQIPAKAALQMEEPAPVRRIYCLTKPTDQLNPPFRGAALWRLVSHLSLNYLSLSSEKSSLVALREILKLYDFTDNASVHQQIVGVAEMTSKPVMRRMGKDAWRGFCRGTEVTLTFDEDMYVGGSAFLFSAVLNRFIALYASINSFTQLVVKSKTRAGEWKRWEPMVGEQILL